MADVAKKAAIVFSADTQNEIAAYIKEDEVKEALLYADGLLTVFKSKTQKEFMQKAAAVEEYYEKNGRAAKLSPYGTAINGRKCLDINTIKGYPKTR
jgi:hypothetical protein